MTNQTIDGVPRELLERILSYAWFPSGAVEVFDLRLIDREELRALLDSPTCKTCCDQGEIFMSMGKVESHMLTEPDPIYRGCPDCKPAAQPQGEPVAWQYEFGGKWYNGDDRIKDHYKNTVDAGYKVRNLYAEQPASTS